MWWCGGRGRRVRCGGVEGRGRRVRCGGTEMCGGSD